MDSPSQSSRAWLVANSLDRNRLTSLVAGWRYVAVNDEKDRDELFQEFETELTRPPLLLLEPNDRSKT